MKCLIKYGVIITVLLAINNAINYYHNVWEYNITSKTKYRYEWLKKLKHKPRVVFIGSSTTLSGFSIQALTIMLGLQEGEIVNLATIPNNPEICYDIVSLNASSFCKNAIIVYGVDPWIISEKYYQYFNISSIRMTMRQRYDIIAESRGDIGKIIDILNGGNVKDTIFQRYLGNRNAEIPTEFGEVRFREYDARASLPIEYWFDYPDFPMSAKYLKSIRKLDEFSESQRLRFVVYYPSYTTTFIDNYRSLAVSQIIGSEISQQLRAARIDTLMVSFPDDSYYDIIHVNERGKILNNQRIVKMFREHDITF